MRRQSARVLALLAFAAISIVSCKKDKVEENDEEVITTMILRFTPQGGGTSLTYSFDDADGPGGNNPVQNELVLAPNSVYNVSVQLLNKTTDPAGDITEEVTEESDAHRFYYQPSAGSSITVNGFNNDADGIPLGTSSIWTTGTSATGSVTVTLRHYPGNPPGKVLADAVDSPKSNTDISVEFTSRVQ